MAVADHAGLRQIKKTESKFSLNFSILLKNKNTYK